jgi:quinone-modifying oxidoreductase subunit QmoC
MAILRNATPRFVARLVNEPKLLPVAFAIPVALLLILMAAHGTLRIPEGEMVYAKFIPHTIVDPLFVLTAAWAVICSAMGVKRVWEGFQRLAPAPKREYHYSLLEFITLFIVPAVVEVLKHNKFKDCVVNRARYLAHLNILWGFVLLAITTGSVATGVYLFGKETPWSLTHPVKWIGNLGAIVLIVGSVLALSNRLSRGEDAGKATYFDWLFLVVVLAAGVSGLLTEIFRLAEVRALGYPLYFIHLVFVWFLFAYLPFSKFAHLLYRTTAMVHARYAERETRKAKVISYQWPEEPSEGEGQAEAPSAA